MKPWKLSGRALVSWWPQYEGLDTPSTRTGRSRRSMPATRTQRNILQWVYSYTGMEHHVIGLRDVDQTDPTAFQNGTIIIP